MKTATIDASRTAAHSAEASGSAPDWTTNTPAAAGAEYVLCIDPGESGPWLQEVQMTREEFIELKQRLAEKRRLQALLEPEADLLTVDVTEKTEEIVRARLLTWLLQQIGRMNVLDLQDVGRSIDLIANDHGCTTPVESFLHDLLLTHYRFGGITPEWLTRQLDPENSDGFQTNFAQWLETAKRAQRIYSRLLDQPGVR